jgi:hypothetical protein
MRIYAAASALLALVVALSACGGGQQTVGPGGYVPPLSSPQLASPATSTTDETPATTAPASATEPTTNPGSWNTPETPTWDAAQFVTAEKGYSWDQPGGIGGWAFKAKPYCAPSYWSTLDHRVQSAEAAQAAGQGDSGDTVFWQQVRSEKETLFINPTNAYVIIEAGVTPTSEWVRVTYDTTDVTARNPDPAPQYGGQEDLIMSKVGSHWLVKGEGKAAAEG